MRRRDLLRRTTAALALGAATGCLAEPDEAGGEDGGDGAAEGGDDTADGDGAGATADPETTSESATTAEQTDESERATPTVRERGVATYEAECASGDDEEAASVTFDDRRIDVEGAVALPDPCHEPELAADGYDGETLVVTVGAASEDAEMCTQCTAMAEYLIRLGFDEGVPAAVRVEHRTTGQTRTITDTSR